MAKIELTNKKDIYEYNDVFDLENDLIIENSTLDQINPLITLFVDSKHFIDPSELEFYGKEKKDIYQVSYEINYDPGNTKIIFKNIGTYTLYIKYDNGYFYNVFTINKKKIPLKLKINNVCNYGTKIPIYLKEFDKLFVTNELIKKYLIWITLILTDDDNNIIALGSESETIFDGTIPGLLNVHVYSYESNYVEPYIDNETQSITILENKLVIKFKEPITLEYGEALPKITNNMVTICDSNGEINIEELNLSFDDKLDKNEYKLYIQDSISQSELSIDIIPSLIPHVYTLNLRIGNDTTNIGKCILFITKKKNKIINNLEKSYYKNPNKKLDIKSLIKIDDNKQGTLVYDTYYNDNKIDINKIYLSKSGIIEIHVKYSGSEIYLPNEDKFCTTVRLNDAIIKLKKDMYVTTLVTDNNIFSLVDDVIVDGADSELFTTSFIYKAINHDVIVKPRITYEKDGNVYTTHEWGYVDTVGNKLKQIYVPRGGKIEIYYNNKLNIVKKVIYEGTYNITSENLTLERNVLIPINNIRSIKLIKVNKSDNLNHLSYGLFEVRLDAHELNNNNDYRIKTINSQLYIIPEDLDFSLKDNVKREIYFGDKINLVHSNLCIKSLSYEYYPDPKLFKINVLTDTSIFEIGEHNVNIQISNLKANVTINKEFKFTVVPKKIIIDFWPWWNNLKENYQKYGALYVSSLNVKENILNDLEKSSPKSFLTDSTDFKIVPNINIKDYCRAGIYYNVFYDVFINKDNKFVKSNNHCIVFTTDEDGDNIFVPRLYIKPFNVYLSSKPYAPGFLVLETSKNNYRFTVNRINKNNYIDFRFTNVSEKLIQPIDDNVEFNILFDFVLIKHNNISNIEFTIERIDNNKTISSEDLTVYEVGKTKVIKNIEFKSYFDRTDRLRIYPKGCDHSDIFDIKNIRVEQYYNVVTPNKYNYIDHGRNYLFNENIKDSNKENVDVEILL